MKTCRGSRSARRHIPAGREHVEVRLIIVKDVDAVESHLTFIFGYRGPLTSPTLFLPLRSSNLSNNIDEPPSFPNSINDHLIEPA
jgi:hypothetical protein